MKIKMKVNELGSNNGIKVETFKAGETYIVSDKTPFAIGEINKIIADAWLKQEKCVAAK